MIGDKPFKIDDSNNIWLNNKIKLNNHQACKILNEEYEKLNQINKVLTSFQERDLSKLERIFLENLIKEIGDVFI